MQNKCMDLVYAFDRIAAMHLKWIDWAMKVSVLQVSLDRSFMTFLK